MAERDARRRRDTDPLELLVDAIFEKTRGRDLVQISRLDPGWPWAQAEEKNWTLAAVRNVRNFALAFHETDLGATPRAHIL